MTAGRVVPALNEAEDRYAGLGLGLEFAPGDEFAFQRRKIALTQPTMRRLKASSAVAEKIYLLMHNKAPGITL